MKTWRITYPDGASEDVQGYNSRIYNGILTIERGGGSYNRQPRSWPLVSVRSWEEL